MKEQENETEQRDRAVRRRMREVGRDSIKVGRGRKAGEGRKVWRQVQ